MWALYMGWACWACYLLHFPSNWCGKIENINLLVRSWWRGKCFGEDIRQLVKRRDMRQSYLLSNHMLTDEVTVNLNVLCYFMEDRVVGNSGSTCIIPMDRCWTTNRNTQFTQNMAEPDHFSTSGGHRPIFCLSRRFRDSGLLLALPWNQRFSKKHTPASGRPPRVRTASPVNICISW